MLKTHLLSVWSPPISSVHTCLLTISILVHLHSFTGQPVWRQFDNRYDNQCPVFSTLRIGPYLTLLTSRMCNKEVCNFSYNHKHQDFDFNYFSVYSTFKQWNLCLAWVQMLQCQPERDSFTPLFFLLFLLFLIRNFVFKS